MVGTSSDRIGTPEGQAYYATVSKDISQYTGDVPVAPYVGLSYGTFENDLRAIGGVYIQIPDTRWSSTLIHDGKELHPTVSYRFDRRHVLTLLWVATEDLGISYSVAF